MQQSGKKINLNFSQKILLVVFLGLIFLYSFNQINNSDTFYDLKTGQYILENFRIPSQDIFSLPAAGAMWVPHEWLAQLVFYLVHRAGGFLGLIIFSAFLGVLTYFILWRLAFRRGVNFYLSVLFLFLLGYLTLELWVPRPQIFAYLSLAFLIYFLESYRAQPNQYVVSPVDEHSNMGPIREANGRMWWAGCSLKNVGMFVFWGYRYLIGAALTIWFWANTNASFILGLVILIFYFLAEWIKNRWPGKFGLHLSLKEVKNLGILTLVSVLLAFLTPAGYRGFLYGIYVQPVAQTLNVLEWKPITIFTYEIQAKVFLAMLFLADAFLVWFLGFRKKSRDITSLGVALGVSLLPFISIRHVGFWPLAVFGMVSVSLSEFLKNFWQRLENRFSPKIIITSFFILGIILISARLFWMPRALIDKNIIPVAAADFIKENNLRGPLFNLYNEGGYLIWRLWPEDKIFIDGRSEVYRGQPLIDFFTILNRHPGWQKLIDEKYKLNYFFLDSYFHPAVRKSTVPLFFELLNRNFRLVYWDDLTIILARDIPENSSIIKKFGLKYINPFRDPTKIPQVEAKAAAAEIQSLLERHPDSLIIQDYAKRFLLSH